MGEYKIKDLEQLTGVKAHTLRIWEKRYGIIAPQLLVRPDGTSRRSITILTPEESAELTKKQAAEK